MIADFHGTLSHESGKGLRRPDWTIEDRTAALAGSVASRAGKLLWHTERKHTQSQWLRFLKQIDYYVPQDFDIQLIADNYFTHGHATSRH